MIISKGLLEKIKSIIEKQYNTLTISVLGNSVFTSSELDELHNQGIDINQDTSFLDFIYNYNFINPYGTLDKPKTLEGIESQLAIPGIKPLGEAHTYAVEHLNENAKQVLDKLKQDVMTKFEGIIRDKNNDYKLNALMNLNRDAAEDIIVKELTISEIKQELKDFAGEPNRNWDRIIATELSNAIGAGHVDRIVVDNSNKNMDNVLVYRIVVKDTHLCKFCNEFYVDTDGSPKVYRLSTLLANGSNYGKKTSAWNPVTLATHPNERCSGIIELKPGWAVNSTGNQYYIGLDKWKDYINKKVQK